MTIMTLYENSKKSSEDLLDRREQEDQFGVGEIIFTRRLCDLWCEDLDEPIESIDKQSILLVLQKSHPRRPKRLNVNLYRKVLTPAGNVGWVHLSNCCAEREIEK